MGSSERVGYRLTPKAGSDLEAIWLDRAETWSSIEADRRVDTLVAGFELLEAMPSMARGRTELTPPVRIQPMAEHLVVYRVDGDSLLTVRTLGGRQSWRPILEGIDG